MGGVSFRRSAGRLGRWLSLAALCAAAAEPPGPIRFRDVSDSAGLEFVLRNHKTPERRYIEPMAGGVAAFDYDNDGFTDLFFTNGAVIPSLEKESPAYHNRLFRNEGEMKFRDVTAESGLAGAGYSVGAAAADYDNDGHVDLFVAGVHRSILYRNRGGVFEDVTAAAEIDKPAWAVGAAWLDYDNDGWLDLFIVNYVDWSLEEDRFCGDRARGLRVYCHPKYYGALPNALYRNEGDGTFRDVSVESGIAAHRGKGMAAAIADYDGDGLMDVFVTNDYMPNFLFRNRGDGTFEEAGLLAGAAFRDSGETISNMGADFRDYDNDGLLDITVAALAGQTFPLFRNEGGGSFRDATFSSRMARLSRAVSGWSPTLADFNNDGWKDLFVTCSHVNDRVEMFESYRYKLPNALFVNLGDGTFEDVSGSSGLASGPPRVHRGSVVADFNKDGRLDVAVTAIHSAPELWENVPGEDNRWLAFRLTGVRSNRDGIGARVRLAGQHNHMTSTSGYASSSHAPVHFGVGEREVIERVEILWPSGVTQTREKVRTNQLVEVREPEK